MLLPLDPWEPGRSGSLLLDRLEPLAKLGFHTAIASLRDMEAPRRTIEDIGREVIPRASKLSHVLAA